MVRPGSVRSSAAIFWRIQIGLLARHEISHIEIAAPVAAELLAFGLDRLENYLIEMNKAASWNLGSWPAPCAMAASSPAD